MKSLDSNNPSLSTILRSHKEPAGRTSNDSMYSISLFYRKFNIHLVFVARKNFPKSQKSPVIKTDKIHSMKITSVFLLLTVSLSLFRGAQAACTSGQFSVNGTCQSCDSSCLECARMSTYCTKCPATMYFQAATCVSSCAAGLSVNTAVTQFGGMGVCVLDIATLKTMSGPSSFPIWAIIAIVGGVVAFLVLCLVVLCCFFRKQQPPHHGQKSPHQTKIKAKPESKRKRSLDDLEDSQESENTPKPKTHVKSHKSKALNESADMFLPNQGRGSPQQYVQDPRLIQSKSNHHSRNHYEVQNMHGSTPNQPRHSHHPQQVANSRQREVARQQDPRKPSTRTQLDEEYRRHQQKNDPRKQQQMNGPRKQQRQSDNHREDQQYRGEYQEKSRSQVPKDQRRDNYVSEPSRYPHPSQQKYQNY